MYTYIYIHTYIDTHLPKTRVGNSGWSSIGLGELLLSAVVNVGILFRQSGPPMRRIRKHCKGPDHLWLAASDAGLSLFLFLVSTLPQSVCHLGWISNFSWENQAPPQPISYTHAFPCASKNFAASILASITIIHKSKPHIHLIPSRKDLNSSLAKGQFLCHF